MAAQRSDKMLFPCPCCGYLTLSSESRGSYEICSICFWEDDAVQFDDPSYEGGANAVSLKQAKKNFDAIGASEAKFLGNVMKPSPDHLRGTRKNIS